MPERIVVGQVAGAFGVRGWIKVRSFTDPPGNLLNYQPWFMKNQEQVIEASERRGDHCVVKLKAIADRDAAIAHSGFEIEVDRALLPPLPEGEYYWQDLLGLRVIEETQGEIGLVDRLVETGANDVIVVRRKPVGSAVEDELWLPYTDEVVLKVDLASGAIWVRWC